MNRFVHTALAVLSVLVCGLALWIVLPPFHAALLPLTIGAPESSYLIVLGAAVLMAGAARGLHSSRHARLAMAVSAAAVGIGLVPLVQAAPAILRFDAATRAVTAPPPSPMPGDVRVVRNVPFSNADNVPLSLDLYQPPVDGSYPVILQVYGGSWQSGSPRSHEWFSRYFAARGYLVAAVDYRHAPEWIWPEQIVDLRTALYWVSEFSDDYNGDPTRIVVVGRSSGAQLAMRLAYQEGPSSIRGVVNYYGPVDLAEGWRRPPRPDPAGVREILEAFIGGTPALKPEHYRHASPITYVSAASAPTLSLYGSRDHVVEARFGRLLDARMKAVGATSVLLELPWSDHAFDAVPSGLGRHLSTRYVERFIAWAVSR